MGDVIEFPAGKVKGLNLKLDGSTLKLFECDGLEEYIDSYLMAVESIRKKNPLRAFLNDALWREDWIRFLVKGIHLGNPYIKYAITGDDGGSKWFLLSQGGIELPAFIDLSEDSLRDIYSRFQAISSEYGDIASVILSSPITNGIGHAEIYDIRNHSLYKRQKLRISD